MTSYDYFAEVSAEELENQNEEEACCLEARALFAAQRGLKLNKKACSEANTAMNAAIGKISRLKQENEKLKEELKRLKDAQPEDEPRCLDADGVPISIGDTVYAVNDAGQPLTARGITESGTIVLVQYENGGLFDSLYSQSVTHRNPDSWKQLEEDANIHPYDYVVKHYGCNSAERFFPDNRIAMTMDIVRRAKRLAGVSDE